MATLGTRDWTGADASTWEQVGFARILGSAFNATVLSNQGRCGSTAAERIYSALVYPASPNHKAALDLDWGNAVGSSRIPGIGVRWTDDGTEGYLAEVDSNTDAPRVRLRRRKSGAYTTLVDWVDISGALIGLDGAALEAGVTVELRVENQTNQVNLVVRVSGQVAIEHDDTDAARIEGGGLVVVKIDGNSTLGDVTYDNLLIEDFEDEATASAAELDAGVALSVDGVYYSWDELVEADIQIGVGRQSYTKGDGWEFRSPDLMDAADGILYPGAVVKVFYEGTCLASGRLKGATRALRPGEGRSFGLRPARDLAADVHLRHPTTQANTIQWNLPEEHAEYDAAFADKTIGEAIAQVLDEHADGDTGLRAHLAAPPDEDDPPYVQVELDALTSKVRGMSGSTDPVACIEQLLAYTKYALFIDPDTLVWHIKSRLSGTIHQVSVDVDHVLGEYVIDLDRNYTAIVVQGERPELEETAFHNETGGGLEKGWPAALEATHTAEKAITNRKEGLVASIGGSAGAPTMTPNPTGYSMEALEWVKCSLGFEDGPEAGEIYEVTTNTTLAFTVVGPWRNGGPAVGNTFVVSGNAAGGGRDNAHTEMGRRYLISDSDRGIAADACARVTIITEKLSKITTGKVETPTTAGEKASILLDLPTIGLVNYEPAANPSPCEAGGAIEEARAEFTLPTYSRSDPRVPTLWYPYTGSKNGYKGTAFTTDSAKWAGAGKPGKGDPGVMRPYPVPAPEFDGSADQIDEWEAVCEEMLAFLSPVARSVTLEIAGSIDTSWAGLGCRLQVVGGPTELETLTDLTVLAVEWDIPRNVTRVFAGTLAAGEYDMQQMRSEMIARNVKRREQRDLSKIQRLLDCLNANFHSAGYARQRSPEQICATEVTSDVTKEGRSVKEDLTVIEFALRWLWEQLGEEKFEDQATDDDGSFWIKKGGVWYWMDADGQWHIASDTPISEGGTGANDSDPPTGDPTITHPDELGEGSIEGIMWTAIQGILANLGKTIDLQTGRVIVPGTQNNTTTNPEDHDWVTFDHDEDGEVDRTPVPRAGTPTGGGEVPDTVIGRLQANKAALEKTLLGHTASDPHAGPQTVTAPNGGVYTPLATGYARVSGPGLAAPLIGGAVGAIAGKCSSTFDGAPDFGSGPGTLLEPGTLVSEHGAYYHPPTGSIDDVCVLESMDTVPASSQMQARSIARGAMGLEAYDLKDPGGVVYRDLGRTSEGTRYWRCEPETERMREVEQVTTGDGLNAGQWEYVHPAVYNESGHQQTWKFSVRARTAAALSPASSKADRGYAFASELFSGTMLPLMTGRVLGGSIVGPLVAQDGVTLEVGDRFLVLNEADTTKNGVYRLVSAGSPSTKWEAWRDVDFDTVDKIRPGATVYVEEGTTHEKTIWVQTALAPLVPHTGTQEWEKFGPVGGLTITADSGWGSPSGVVPARNGVTATTTHNQLLAIVAAMQEAFLASKIPQA